MKKIISLMVLCTMVLAFAACSKNDSPSGLGPTGNTEGQYLIMLYGAGGGNLDGGISANILQSLCSGSTDKVKMTYCFRFSKALQTRGDKFRNLRRFTADENKSLVGSFDAETPLSYDKSLQMWEQVTSHEFGDTSYVLSSDTALASFIQWSKKQYPEAKHFILILNDHGGAWELRRDGEKDNPGVTSTIHRSIVMDDNTGDCLTLGDVKKALSANPVDVLYDDACLMATWENLTGYSKIPNLKYFLGSLETAPGVGGNYYKLLARVKAAQQSGDLKGSLESYVDDIVKGWWPNSESEQNPIYGDFGCYDLTQIAEPLAVVKQVNQEIIQDYNKWGTAFDSVAVTCLMASNAASTLVPLSMIPQSMQEYLEQHNAPKEDGGYSGQYVIKAFQMMDDDMIRSQAEADQYVNLWTRVSNLTTDSYPYADFIRTIIERLDGLGVSRANNPFVALQQNYITALKSFAHIQATHVSAEQAQQYGMIDYTYNCCSPGVFLFPLKEGVYDNPANYAMRYSRYGITRSMAVAYYTATDFHQASQWGTVLELIGQCPTIITNPVREELE